MNRLCYSEFHADVRRCACTQLRNVCESTHRSIAPSRTNGGFAAARLETPGHTVEHSRTRAAADRTPYCRSFSLVCRRALDTALCRNARAKSANVDVGRVARGP